MKRARKILGVATAVFAALALILVVTVQLRWRRTFDAPYPQIVASSDPAVIEQGRYIVFGAGHCVSCHTDDSQAAAVRAGATPLLSGGNEFSFPMGKVRTPNLTPDPETGIGRRTDAELARILRYGVRHDGRAAMPFMEFQNMSDEDLRAVISFLRSQEPVRKQIPEHEFTLVGKAVLSFLIEPIGPKGEPPRQSPPQAPTVERGEYVATAVAGCAECHTERNPLDGSYVGAKFAGGFAMQNHADPDTLLVTPNLTPEPRTGRIASWSEEQFLGRFEAGVGIPGSHMPWKQFQSMSATDIQAVYRYLRSLDPVVNDTGPSVQSKAAHKKRKKDESA